MARALIITVVLAAAFQIFAVVDAAMTEPQRTRGVSKPVWVVLVVFLPVIGGILWLTIGKVRDSQVGGSAGSRGTVAGAAASGAAAAADALSRLNESSEARLRELEERLRELDNETFPGEDPKPTDDSDGDKPEENN
ncbi:PLD nuclease N-terminal domain-containing protein [Canibacter zhoujuaniae]|uniref:PLD nuclease N-terminal domain-containing protein n=1 Tax=Canibacter zhoujuaniae TaxID=2708343 RepID=UPI001423C46E|nr:PLD nuclease N-terminal domain-containing protein [Canibacter zhoujuaniae]